MPRAITLQTNFNSGELDPRLAARTDVKQYYQGAAIAKNVLSMPQGGLKRRPGMGYKATLSGEARLAAFSFNTEQTYLIVFTDRQIEIFKDGVSQATVTTSYTTAQLFKLNWTQSADTMIIVHEDHQPRKLVRGSTHASWTLSTISLSNIPQYNGGNVWSNTNGWPKSVTFFSGRMWFGGSKKRPQSLWGSKTNDFYNFDLGTSLDDESIYVTLDTDQVNAITGIFAGRHLQIFTTGGEFYMADAIITPEKSSVRRQSLFGSSSVRPKSLDGSTLFLDRTGKSIREFIYTYTEDAYTSTSTSLLASHLLSSPVDMDVSRGTSKDDANYLYLVNDNGTMAVFSILRNQEVSGWTQWVTAGNIEAVCVVVDDVYFVTKRTINGSVVRFLEMIDVDSYTDASERSTPNSATVTGLGHLDGEECRVKADDSVMPNATPSAGSITLSRSAQTAEVGLNYDTLIKTMPLNMDFQNGPTLMRKKRIIRVILDVYESLGLHVDGTLMPDRALGVGILNNTPTPYTGLKDVYQMGWSELSQVEITQVDPVPMMLLGLSLEVET